MTTLSDAPATDTTPDRAQDDALCDTPASPAIASIDARSSGSAPASNEASTPDSGDALEPGSGVGGLVVHIDGIQETGIPDIEGAALVLAAAIVAERGAPSQWRAAPIRNGLASAVVDAVMTPRITTSTVDTTVRRYETAFGIGDVPGLIASFGIGPDRWRREIATNHRTFSHAAAPYKAHVILAAAQMLADHGVLTVGNLWARAEDDDLRRSWCALPGQSSGATWRHLLLVTGYTETVICPLTRRFARRHLPRALADSPDLLRVIALAADVLDATTFDTEHQMWRAATSPPRREENPMSPSEAAPTPAQAPATEPD